MGMESSTDAVCASSVSSSVAMRPREDVALTSVCELENCRRGMRAACAGLCGGDGRIACCPAICPGGCMPCCPYPARWGTSAVPARDTIAVVVASRKISDICKHYIVTHSTERNYMQTKSSG